jgi:CO/xanthine dehydrogenase FAD-binding subunit
MRAFDLVVARDLPHLLDLLVEHPTARPVAGATDFIPFVQTGKWRPELAVDITGIADLQHLRIAAGFLEIGSLVTHGELASSTLVRKHALALAQAAESVADPQIRCRATVGGNICTASPAADTVPALLALEAEVELTSRRGTRCLPLESFLLGPGRTALGPGEILASVRFPILGPQIGSTFVKLGRRSAMAISIVNAAAVIVLDSAGRLAAARLALGSVAPTVVRCRAVENALAARGDTVIAPATAAFTAATSLVTETIRPIDDVRASAAYRSAVAPEVARRALEGAWTAAGGRI